MKEYPIFFNTEEVRTILAGRKTQTRRVIKSQNIWFDTSANPPTWYDGIKELKSPYGQAGDRLWVRETWAVNAHYDYKKPSDLSLGYHSLDLSYIADFGNGKPGYLGRTRPSISLPRWASRILLPVLNVRYERLQEISYDDALAEGCPSENLYDKYPPVRDEWGRLIEKGRIGPVGWFANLWDSINAKRGYSWASNSWVRVIEFPKYENRKESKDGQETSG